MTPTARQIAENVAVLLVRTDMTNKDLGRILGISPQSVGQRLRGRIEWRAAELDVLARALHVTPSELMGRLPDFKEWDRRTAAPGPIAAAGPRYLVMPEAEFDGFAAPLSRSPEMSIIGTLLALLATLLRNPDALRRALPDAPQLPNLQQPRRTERLPRDVRTTSLPAAHRTGVTLTRGLTRHSKRPADHRPGRAPVACSRHQQHRRSL